MASCLANGGGGSVEERMLAFQRECEERSRRELAMGKNVAPRQSYEWDIDIRLIPNLESHPLHQTCQVLKHFCLLCSSLILILILQPRR